MPSRKKRENKHRFLRFTAGTLAVLACIFLLLVAATAVFAARNLDTEADEALFSAAGGSTLTRFYFDGADGETVEALPGYRAVEWEEESFSGAEKSLYTPLSEMPSYLPMAFVAIEDHRFYEHDGVDVLRTGKAVFNHLFRFSGRFGGSTITQQLIKNIGGESEISVKRKLKEMLRALSLEKRHSKNEILEAYLNIVPLSRNCIGVGAASEAYFGKKTQALSLAEAASLAAITRSPSAFDPTLHPQAHIKRRNLVLSRMLSLGYIGEEEYQAAVNTPLSLSPAPWQNKKVSSWYAETVLNDVEKALTEEGYSRSVAHALVMHGGLRIYTCMDKRVQGILEGYFTDRSHFSGMGDGFSAAMTVIDPKTGNLLGIVGNRGEKTANRTLNHATDTLRAPGSVLKPVALYAPAIDAGLVNEATVFDDVPKDFSAATPWPHNSPARYDGLVNTKTALTYSKNTVAVELYRQLGPERIYHTLYNGLGISSLCRRGKSASGHPLTDLAPAPLALGQLTYGVNLREMTAAYLPLSDGVMRNNRSFLLVLDRDGKALLKPDEGDTRIFRQTTASVMTHMLSAVVEDGTAKSLKLKNYLDTAGKTGTSGQNRDRWFIGYTPYYLAGIWCGYEEGKKAVTGTPQLKAWDEIMCLLHRDILKDPSPVRSFVPAPGLRACRICRDSGLLCSEHCAHDPRGDRAMTVWLRADEIPTATCQRHVPVLYDSVEGGVVREEEAEGREGLIYVSLLDIPWRDFPRQVIVGDAEYVYRCLDGKEPSLSAGEPYFAPLLPRGHYAGISARSTRQYNAYAPPPKEEEDSLPLHAG